MGQKILCLFKLEVGASTLLCLVSKVNIFFLLNLVITM